jgi:hypothetical protein
VALAGRRRAVGKEGADTLVARREVGRLGEVADEERLVCLQLHLLGRLRVVLVGCMSPGSEI